MTKITIGARGSKLSLAYVAIVKELSETAIPIVLKPTSRPTRICDV